MSNVITHADLPIMRALRDAYRQLIHETVRLKSAATDTATRTAFAIIQDDIAEKFTNIGRNMTKLEETN